MKEILLSKMSDRPTLEQDLVKPWRNGFKSYRDHFCEVLYQSNQQSNFKLLESFDYDEKSVLFYIKRTQNTEGEITGSDLNRNN